MPFDAVLQSLKAAADPTRLRLLAVLAGGEATVGELQEILDQSQPRVSRHLRLLVEADLVDRFRDGHWVYYRLARTPAAEDLVAEIIRLAGPSDPVLQDDREALAQVKLERERHVYNGAPSPAWIDAEMLGQRPAVSELLATIEDSLGETRLGDVLDVGSGVGNLMCVIGPRARRVIGVDTSQPMRMLARSRIHRAGLTNCTVRDGDVHNLPFDDSSFDSVILDEVLAGSANPQGALREARRVVRPEGTLLILDHIGPAARSLSGHQGELVLIDNQLTALLAQNGWRVRHRHWFPGRAMEYALFSALPQITELRSGTDD